MGCACLMDPECRRTPRGGTRRKTRARPAARALTGKNQTHKAIDK